MTAPSQPSTRPRAPIPRRDWLLLALFCLVLLWLHGAWVGENGWIRASDEAIHQLGALRVHRALLGEESLVQVLLPSARELWRTGADQSLYYPPLSYLVSAASFFVLGDTVQAADLSLGLFQVLLVLGTWLLVWRVAGRRAAWGASLLGCTAPSLLSYGRCYFLELPATAWLVWSVLCLSASRGLTRRGWVLAFALCASAGLFSRWNFALFLAAPTLAVMALALMRGWRAAGEGARRGPLSLLLPLSLAPFALSLGALALFEERAWTPGAVATLHLGWWALHGSGLAACLLLARRWAAWAPLAVGCAALWLVAGICAPLYLVFTPLLSAKYFVMFGSEAQLSFGWYLQAILSFHWLAWLLVPLGLGWIAVSAGRRRAWLLPVVTLLAGAAATLSVTDTNVRYVLLLVPFAAAVATGWLGGYPRLARAVLPLFVLASAWQAGGWWVLERQPWLRSSFDQAPILNIGEEHRWALPQSLLPRASAAPLVGEPPLGAILAVSSQHGRGRAPSIAMLDTRRTPTPLESDWWRYHAYRQRVSAPVAQINAPWFDPPRAEQLLWISDTPEAFPFVNHALSVWAGWDLRSLGRVSMERGAHAWLFTIRHRDVLERTESLYDLPGLVERGEAAQCGQGWVYGRVLGRGDDWVDLSVLGRPQRFAFEPETRLDPALRPGRWASLTHRGQVTQDGAVLARKVWPAYTPTRFREGVDYPPPPRPRGRPRGLACGVTGTVVSLQPDRIALEGGGEIPLGRDVRLPAAEIFPGARVCLERVEVAGTTRRIGLLPADPGDTQAPP